MPSASSCSNATALCSRSPPIRSSPEPRAFQQSSPPRAAAHSRYPALPIVTRRQPRSLAGCKHSVSPSSSISPRRSLAPSGGPAPPLGGSRCRECRREKLSESRVCSQSMSKVCHKRTRGAAEGGACALEYAWNAGPPKLVAAGAGGMIHYLGRLDLPRFFHTCTLSWAKALYHKIYGGAA